MNNKQIGKYFDLTTSQLMIWTGQQMNPSSPMYNMVLSFELATTIQVSHFQTAFGQLVQACDTMRTVFVEVDGKPQQKILHHLPYQLPLEDFSTTLNKDGLLKTWLTNRSQQQFDTQQRLFDAVLIKMAADRYVWYFNQHHLITDAWATTQQYSFLAQFYKNLVEEETMVIAIPSFEEYIRYEAAQKLNTSNHSAITFWEEKALQLPDPPNFFGRTNPFKGSHSERVQVILSKEKSDILRALAMEVDLRTWTQHLSLFSIFSTILLVYIHRITGQQKLSIGTPAHNRSTATFKKTPGMFIELFPLMATVTSDDTFRTLYDKVRNEALAFLRYAKTGVSSPALNRGFNVVLNYINASFSDFNGVPAASEWIHAAHADPGHHLRLQVYDFDASGCIKLCFDLNTSVFEESQRPIVAEQFLVLLDSFIEDRFQPVGQPSLASTASCIEGEKHNFNFEKQATVTTLFEEKVVTLPPDTVAIQFGESSLTYQALDHHANQLAHFLLQNGLGRNNRVGILLTRSPEFVISVLAVLKAGAAFVPIPTNYPVGRIERILEDAHPTLVLSSSVLVKKVPTTFSNVICLDKEAVFIKQQSITRPIVPITTDSLAYMIYTSGSTGIPKGVMIGHEALSHYIQWANHTYTNDIRPIAPLFTSVGFDLTITSLFLPLVAGGTICTYQEAEQGPDLSLLEVLEDNRVNFIKLTPAHLSLIKGNNYTTSSIEVMVVGGENFKTDLAIYVQDNFKKGIKIYNEYGPTEATVGCIVHCYDSVVDKKEIAVPIGLPIANTQLYILDEHKNSVPDGVVGDLYIGGVGLAKGYWNQPALTQEQFITNPFKKDTLLYRTGDLVRKQASKKYVEYLGRKDSQVKIRGRRVELAEVEAVINQYPGLTQGIVELRQKQRVIKEAETHNCTKCGLPSNYPTATFDEKGVCNLCQDFENYQHKVKQYFKTPAAFKALLSSVPQTEKGAYDCLVLLSGGKDSTYVVAKVKEMGFRVLAFTLDNGYISEEAKDNVRRVVTALGVDHIFGQTEAMNAIFVDSLQRHCNVCDGCFKTIYTLSVQLALEKKIPFIITGLSRGQFFETRLTEELFRQEVVDVDKIDKIILNARKAYHQTDDAVKKLLDVSMFEDESIFEKVRFVDFYRYTDVSLEEMLAYLNTQLPWERPSDTGRSTNCLINQAGIYVHKKKLGYSNYAFPYSWDVRIGHKTRQASLEEINEEIKETEVLQMLEEIGYTEAEQADESKEQLVAYYVAESDIHEPALRNYLLTHFPDYMVPVQFIPLEKLPLTINGKIDRAALPRPDTIRPVLQMEYVAPQTEFEAIIQATWSEVLQIDQIGIHDNFLEIGGDSLSGIRVISRLNEAFELELPINLIFKKPSIHQLANHIEETIKQLLNIS